MLDFMDAPLMKPRKLDPNTPPGVRHIAMRVASEADHLEIQRRVGARGLNVDDPVSRGRHVGAYFHDPFGNRLEAAYAGETPPADDPSKARTIVEEWETHKARGEFTVR